MRKVYLLSVLFLFALTASGQKIKIKDGIATVDKKPYLKIEQFAMRTELSIKGLNSDQEEISAMYLNYKDPNEVSTGNSKGYVRWVEIKFLDYDLVCEVSTRSNKRLVKLLHRYDIYVDGELREENVRRFVKKYGTRYSDNRPKEGGKVEIHINN